jgi:hypothetical protein
MKRKRESDELPAASMGELQGAKPRLLLEPGPLKPPGRSEARDRLGKVYSAMRTTLGDPDFVEVVASQGLDGE